jgi:hypothetical protein
MDNELPKNIKKGDKIFIPKETYHRVIKGNTKLVVEIKKVEENQKEDNPCWDGYEMIGMKDKNGKEVPNCVPKNESLNNKKIYKESIWKPKKINFL